LEKYELTLLEYLKIISSKKKFIFVFVFTCVSLSIIISLFLLPKWYKATAIILSPQSVQSPLGSMGLLSDLGMNPFLKGDENVLKYIAILKSRSLHQSVAEKFNLEKRYKCKNIEETLTKFEKNLDYKVGEEFQVSIDFYDKDKYMVANITNYIVYCLDSLNILLSTTNARSNREFLELRVNEIHDSLEITGQELAEFMKKNGILNLDEQVKVGVEQAAYLKSKIIQKEVEFEVMKSTVGKNNPKIDEIKTEINALNKKYTEFTKSNRIENLIPNFDKIPDLELALLEMKRKYEYYSKVMEFLGPQYEQQKFEEVKNSPTLQVLDRAIQPVKKAKPKTTFIALSAMIGSFLLSVFFIGFSNKVKYYKDLTR